MSPEKIYALLNNHIPPPAVDYCYRLWQVYPFELKLRKSRQTKVGDFTSRNQRSHHQITLNHDLNPYLFLITYIHEVAHLYVYIQHQNRVEAHGDEWKEGFKMLMKPMLDPIIFPLEILRELERHMVHPKASSFADSRLTQVLRKFDAVEDKRAMLSDIPEGSIFSFNGRYFKKGKLRRTRILCCEVKSKRHYLVPADALVNDVQLSLL